MNAVESTALLFLTNIDLDVPPDDVATFFGIRTTGSRRLPNSSGSVASRVGRQSGTDLRHGFTETPPPAFPEPSRSASPETRRDAVNKAALLFLTDISLTDEPGANELLAIATAEADNASQAKFDSGNTLVAPVPKQQASTALLGALVDGVTNDAQRVVAAGPDNEASSWDLKDKGGQATIPQATSGSSAVGAAVNASLADAHGVAECASSSAAAGDGAPSSPSSSSPRRLFDEDADYELFASASGEFVRLWEHIASDTILAALEAAAAARTTAFAAADARRVELKPPVVQSLYTYPSTYYLASRSSGGVRRIHFVSQKPPRTDRRRGGGGGGGASAGGVGTILATSSFIPFESKRTRTDVSKPDAPSSHLYSERAFELQEERRMLALQALEKMQRNVRQRMANDLGASGLAADAPLSTDLPEGHTGDRSRPVAAGKPGTRVPQSVQLARSVTVSAKTQANLAASAAQAAQTAAASVSSGSPLSGTALFERLFSSKSGTTRLAARSDGITGGTKFLPDGTSLSSLDSSALTRTLSLRSTGGLFSLQSGHENDQQFQDGQTLQQGQRGQSVNDQLAGNGDKRQLWDQSRNQSEQLSLSEQQQLQLQQSNQRQELLGQENELHQHNQEQRHQSQTGLGRVKVSFDLADNPTKIKEYYEARRSGTGLSQFLAPAWVSSLFRSAKPPPLSPAAGVPPVYYPEILDDPGLRAGAHRSVMKLAAGVYSSTLLPFVKPKVLKGEVNRAFAERHSYFPPTVTLSRLRKYKRAMLDSVLDANLELSTVAVSFSLLDKLLLRLWLPAIRDKEAFKRSAAVCLMLAAKFSDPQITGKSDLKRLIRPMEKRLGVSHKDVFAMEFDVYAQLHFSVFLPLREFVGHFTRIHDDLEVVDDDYYSTKFLFKDN